MQIDNRLIECIREEIVHLDHETQLCSECREWSYPVVVLFNGEIVEHLGSACCNAGLFEDGE